MYTYIFYVYQYIYLFPHVDNINMRKTTLQIYQNTFLYINDTNMKVLYINQ